MAKEMMTLGKIEVEVELCEMNQVDLQFCPENPRVYSILNTLGKNPTQDEIQKYMCSLDHVKQLKESIASNGGLIDPLIVKSGSNIVIEGNSRLAAYRLLAEKDPIKWGKVKCKILPENVQETSVFALLGQYHIIGKKDWDPFEQAHYLYRRYEETKIPISRMANELGITKGYAEKMIETIKFMIDNGDLNKRHWSYYEEYLKNAAIKKLRQENPTIDTVIVQEVKDETIGEAANMRDLGKVIKMENKVSKKAVDKICSGELTVTEVINDFSGRGLLDNSLLKLKNFRKQINAKGFGSQLTDSKELQKQAIFEIKQIIKSLEGLQKKLEQE